MKLEFGGKCPKCKTEIVKIARETLEKIIAISPILHSVSKEVLSTNFKYIPICPQCDAYALGIEFEEGFPFIMKNGQETEIHQIENMLWNDGEPFCSKNI